MNSKQKRFRQISLKESFNFSKKPKQTTSDIASMDENLRALLAATAEKRRQLNNGTSNGLEKGSTSNSSEIVPNTQIKPSQPESHTQIEPSQPCLPESQETIEEQSVDPSCSADLFPSLDNFEPSLEVDSPVVEQCSSQESMGSEIIQTATPVQSSAEFDLEEYEETKSETSEDSDDEAVQLSFFNRLPDCNTEISDLEPLENHSVLFSIKIQPDQAPKPFPTTYRDQWDSDYVRLPCSDMNKFPFETRTGEKIIRSRWDMICKSLRREITCSEDLEEAIMWYNSQYRGKWNFDGLHSFFNLCFTDDGREHFFEDILPSMISMALSIQTICTQPIPLLRQSRDHSITMSQKQIGCLLLNAFFCTFPRRNVTRRFQQNLHEYSSYPDINFYKLFSGPRNKVTHKTEKLKCIFNYFRRIVSKEPVGCVTFHRQCLTEIPCWSKSNKRFKSAVIKTTGLIESEGHGMLQVDFANKFVGGGVLGHGCVQEEIRFVICPELLVSMLFTESLLSKEALIVTGVEQYNSYSGYSNTFKWEGNFEDTTARDAWGRRCTQVVAIDAIHFTNTGDQYKSNTILRELNKAYCGFYEDCLPHHLPAVATGNWGCGAFKGDPHLKFLVQLMAASEAERDVIYFTFSNKTLKKDLKDMHALLVDKNLSVGDLWRCLVIYCNKAEITYKGATPKLYDYLTSVLAPSATAKSSDKDTNVENELTDSDKDAMRKIIEDDIIDDSTTEIEDSESNDTS